jgi:hypothetical protein
MGFADRLHPNSKLSRLPPQPRRRHEHEYGLPNLFVLKKDMTQAVRLVGNTEMTESSEGKR